MTYISDKYQDNSTICQVYLNVDSATFNAFKKLSFYSIIKKKNKVDIGKLINNSIVLINLIQQHSLILSVISLVSVRLYSLNR